MKTAQIMSRPLLDGSIRQNHKTNWFNATDLLKLANRRNEQLGKPTKKIAHYFENDSTKDFMMEIMEKESLTVVYDSKKGKNGGTWVHPLLLIDIAMWLSPEFKYNAMKWLEDELTNARDESGESYKKMASAVANYMGRDIARAGTVIPKIAKAIKTNLNVTDWNNTTADNLKKRDEIQKNISILLKAGVEINRACITSIKEVLAS